MSAEMTVVSMTSAAALSSHKIVPRHHERAAIVYIRQSTVQQLVRHQESTRLQYGLTERAGALGWTRDRVVVIDDDLGRSGANAEGRPGFQRLVAEVGLDHVGIILGIGEKFPEAKPRIISDNGPQFIARDFKEFIRVTGMTHVRTSTRSRTGSSRGRARASRSAPSSTSGAIKAG